ncbi:DUF2809 domain-containing protein [Chitinophaga sp. Cy-1792]|uniref:ribosomal maturation YjgA family protein n=1 Tax=Chitinophaga sp. Cy-1792 TaxID=2608339 RepID=UPI001423342D|nr:DUF2809 domain-containing protein [Chitinophaga sp. Cy-1792]NIG53804.1 DUF2809 domain-containing protein [Chitinophaga sp. Cy-1792]
MNNNLRIRLYYVLLLAVTMWAGLATRHTPDLFPKFISEYGGDILYATFAVFGLRFLWLKPALWKILLAGFIYCVLIEIQQCCQAPWLVQLRNTFPFGLILGYGFLWSDIVCYAAGVLLAWPFCLVGEKIWKSGNARV